MILVGHSSNWKWLVLAVSGEVLGSEAFWRMPQLHCGSDGWNWWVLSSPGLPLAANSLEGAVSQTQGGSAQSLPGRLLLFSGFPG